MLGYMDWLTQAEDIEAATGGGSALKIDVSKQKGDPVVMGLLKSTMFPLQQVLEGKMGGLLANGKWANAARSRSCSRTNC